MIQINSNFEDYRLILKDIFKRMNLSTTKISQEVGIQRTLLSKVFNFKSHMNSDQLYQLLSLTTLSSLEKKFLYLLLEKDRTGIVSRKEEIDIEIDKTKNELIDSKNYLDGFDSPVFKGTFENLYKYYSNPHNLIIHMFLQIDSECKNKKDLFEQLKINQKQFIKTINTLQDLSIIRVKSIDPLKVQVLENVIHLDKGSSIQKSYQSAMRNLCIEKVRGSVETNNHNMLVTLAISDKAKNLIDKEIVIFLKKIQEICIDKDPKHIYQMNLDFFPWLDGNLIGS